MKLLVLSSLQPRRKSTIQITRTSPTLKATGKAKWKQLEKVFRRDGQSKDEALGVTINAVILLVLLRWEILYLQWVFSTHIHIQERRVFWAKGDPICCSVVPTREIDCRSDRPSAGYLICNVCGMDFDLRHHLHLEIHMTCFQEGIRFNLHQIMEVEKTNISCLSMPQNK